MSDQSPELRVPRSIRQVDRDTSLHAQGRVFQLKYLTEQAKSLLSGIDDLIAATERCAPVRTKQPYVLERIMAGSPINEEARWERAIWSEWHDSSREFIPGVCSSIMSYQVMLRDRNTDKKWGEVDLLGRARDDAPVVIELKGPSSTEPPLRGIVEGVAYAIAIRKAWTPCFGQQWCDRLQIALPDRFPVCRTIFAAPADYWDRISGKAGPAWKVSTSAWDAIERLMQAFAERQLPVSLVRLDAGDPRTPKGISATIVDR
jgi:hypothetical protein